MAKRRSTSPKRKRKSRKSSPSRFRLPWLRLGLVALVLFAGYCVYLDAIIRSQFEGKRWSLPARVYARPLELYAGLHLDPDGFAAALQRTGYQSVPALRHSGQVSRDRGVFHLYTRRFDFWDGQEPAQRVNIAFAGDTISTIDNLDTGQSIDLLRLDPEQIASIYPSHKEDRILVRLQQVPPFLTQALIAVEDRQFYQHHGVSPRAIARALLVDIKAGGVVQGGSTLTQQLVKNFFLSQQRTLLRKLNEALMAVLLEFHYSKAEILEAYLNEVYLGQDGARAIHGFGLASQFYFGRALPDLSEEQMALLVGLVKGPSYYDPRRHPAQARQRRDLVLDILAEQGIITTPRAAVLKQRPLGVVPVQSVASNAHPAFLDLVRQQLYRDYREEDLRSDGLRIFTTLDPVLQRTAEHEIASRLSDLERGYRIPPDKLQGSIVVTRYQDGEVLALVGDRDAMRAGFNRALTAERQIGSLVKPFVYLTALQSRRYTLASQLDDTPLSVDMPTTGPWTPQNYDHKFRGKVLLYQALMHSLNVPTARVGLDIGLDKVIDTLHTLGFPDEIRPLPSLLLGAVEMTPLQVTQLYQSLAANGFRSPLRAITAVVSAEGEPLQRYPLEVEQAADASAVSLIQYDLQQVVMQGTARSLGQQFGAQAGLAGKTGTTDDLRDSWFAGFDGEKLMVVWVGRDDNQPMGLTGSQGALQVWQSIAGQVGVTPLMPSYPDTVKWQDIDTATGLLADAGCPDRVKLPFLEGTVPTRAAPCAGLDTPGKWIRRWLDQ